MPSCPSCTTLVTVLTNLHVNWEAWSAIGTIGATIVALFLPRRQAIREWARQDKIRQEEAQASKDFQAANHREIVSAVDRVLAYREAAIAIFVSEPVYQVGVRAIKRISLNTQILADLITLLQIRPGLSDGAIYSALAAHRIATDIVASTARL